MKSFARFLWLGGLGLASLLGSGPLLAQVRNPVPVPPFEVRQDRTDYNLQSVGGVPISSTPGDPPGSNGRAPTAEQQRADGLTELPATPRQFQGRITFGALAAPRNTQLNPGLSYAANAGSANLDLPRGENGGQIVVVMTRALVGAPWLSRNISFLFGAPIPPPLVDVEGNPLPPGTLPQEYWVPEPHRPSRLEPHEILDLAGLANRLNAAADPLAAFVKDQLAAETRSLLSSPGDPNLPGKLLTDLNTLIAGPSIYALERFSNVTLSLETQILDPAGTSDARPARLNRLLLEDAFAGLLARTTVSYYWSPHARTAYAIQPGPVDVVWRKAQPQSSKPADYDANPSRYWVDAGNYYTLYRARYVVSGSPFKPPRKIYWTEGVFRPTGKPVAVPAGRVSVLNVVYNNNFPRRVDTPYRALGQTPIVENPNAQLEESRTLWYESSRREILAYNVEGRVFVELLGEAEPGGRTRRPLGYEIVDVIREPQPADVTTELGEVLTAYPLEEQQDDSALYPDLVAGSQDFVYQHFLSDAPRPLVFATRETLNRNDVQVHWLETGIEGLRWPFRFVRYRQVWPVDILKYSHYLRPRVNSEAEARATAVPLPAENAPIIDYQDPLDQPRAKLTETFAFYTWLTDAYPVHRTLLRFRSGEQVRFERVLSWLETVVKQPNLLAGSFATGLTVTDPATGKPSSIWGTNTWRFPDALPLAQTAPRVIEQSVAVGQRILAPAGERGAEGDYWAGYIQQSHGNAFHPGAYRDPFVAGFESANLGAIIPVNAAPGNDRLEVWWFRVNALSQPQMAQGFKAVYWPSVLGRYTIGWPLNAPEIVLASNDGSGPLSSLEARAQIYVQNDRRLPGFNPNEEHALMQGGQAWALRDDLNITSGPDYTSEPYVLLDYVAADGRPAMTVFKVRRERPETGDVFDYVVEAGTVLQPPMPLPLLGLPLAPKIIGQPPRSLNREIRSWQVTSTAVDESAGYDRVTLTTETPHGIGKTRTLYLQDPANLGLPAHRFLVTGVDYTTRKLEGVVLAQNPIALSEWTGTPATEFARRRFGVATDSGLTNGTIALAVDPVSRQSWKVELMGTGTESGATYLELEFAGLEDYEAGEAARILAVPDNLITDGRFDGRRLGFEPLPRRVSNPSLRAQYASFTLQDRKGNIWVYRGPHDTGDRPTMAMQFYYKTLPGFFFPTLPLENQPPVGTITPYLRPRNDDGTYAGDPVYGNRLNPQTGDDNALLVHYSPVWPANTPVLQMAESLTLPKRGLPAIRGQTSLEVVYQQSQVVRSDSAESVVLHDPTREKVFDLGPPEGVGRLGKIPDSVHTTTYRGRIYFPNLPPHLSERFFLDPNRGEFGALVFAGEFRDEPAGDDYLLLNVLGANDRDRLKALCLPDDPARQAWEAAVDGLATDLSLYVENPARPGTYYPRDATRFGPADLTRITDDDQAVDSYALTAVGPGTGYVTLIAGNGLAFTPEAEPVSVHILRVVDTLYRGELKVVASSNPLSEILTLQQVVDLAGRAEDYNFEWKIAAPVDGLPPAVFQNTYALLLGDGAWQHLPFTLASDRAATVSAAPANRVVADVGTTVVPRQRVPFAAASRSPLGGLFVLDSPPASPGLVPGNRLVLRDANGQELNVTVHGLSTQAQLVLEPEAEQPPVPADFLPIEAYEQVVNGQPQSIVFRQFEVPADANYGELWLSLDLDDALGARVYLDGQRLVEANLGDADTPRSSPPEMFQPLSRAYRLDSGVLAGGTPQPGGLVRHTLAVELFSSASPDARLIFNVRLEASEVVDVTDAGWLPLDASRFPDGTRALLGGQADVRALSDNYLIMRYQAKNPDHASFRPDPGNPDRNLAWSTWTRPMLAEGWIKRVLAGINPFNQRVADLFSSRVSTDVSIIQQAGPRWEGDVALNLDSLNQFGLIEIYETVLRRGKMLSIDAGINYGPANDALLLAAGYLNDLYMMLGNEAWADAANPTIGIGTKDRTYGEIATALFAFRGQVPSLLEEELALLRGRDDFLMPGVEIRPVYNRLYWNYTRGIDAGEVIYALNYNILDLDENGRVDADDARRLYPQGHGDAYGHYLTALKGYYGLLMNTDFDWVPRIEAVLVLGQPVSVDYQDERKFAAAAAAVARTGKQITDLTWRRDYRHGRGIGWSHLSESKVNNRRTLPTQRDWGVDHWATRTGQGAYLHWVVGNAILPDRDPDPTHEGGIQQVDRTTVVELLELPAIAGSLQTTLDNAEAGLNPLGLPETAVPFDINPTLVVGAEPQTHFEQIYARALAALQNALAAFDDAKDVTRLMRSEEDSLAEFRTLVNRQELAYTHQLIELYGTPYPDDIGPGKTYPSGYNGPDLMHYMYVDLVELSTPLLDPAADASWRIDIQTFTPNWLETNGISDFTFITKARVDGIDRGLDPNPWASGYNTNHYVEFNLPAHGFFGKPAHWTGRRASPGRIQQAISDIIKARNAAYLALYKVDAAKGDLDWALAAFERKKESHEKIRDWQAFLLGAEQTLEAVKTAVEIVDKILDVTSDQISFISQTAAKSLPTVFIAGLAAGGDLTAPARAAIEASGVTFKSVTEWKKVGTFAAIKVLEVANQTTKRWTEFDQIQREEWNQALRDATSELRDKVYGVQNLLPELNPLAGAGRCPAEIPRPAGRGRPHPGGAPYLPPAGRGRHSGLPHPRRRLPHLPQRKTRALQGALRPGRSIHLHGRPGLRL
ncbi:hypothetical protein [Limisphaera sp. VF-2]|uniref:hypothetical protein n=1 Tax=Limisphaera sp. VF-2 TaxID=3400418 RepID=UPI003C1F3085